ncbi:MAG: DUF2437 domain-containing protein [Lapillicoccus sp.]
MARTPAPSHQRPEVRIARVVVEGAAGYAVLEREDGTFLDGPLTLPGSGATVRPTGHRLPLSAARLLAPVQPPAALLPARRPAPPCSCRRAGAGVDLPTAPVLSRIHRVGQVSWERRGPGAAAQRPPRR